jgi:hypothetical protein
MARTAKGGEGVIKFPTFWPRAFALIGDVYSTLRDRCIVINLQRATPGQLEKVKRYRRDDAIREASAFVRQLEAWREATYTDGTLSTFPVTEASWMSGREEELWTPLYSTLKLLGVDAETVKRFRVVSADLAALKSMDARRYTDAQKAEDEARDVSYGERALRDLIAVLREDERAIFSAVAVQRMRAIVDGPWRTFKGEGLTENRLADLVSRFGVQPKLVRVGGGRSGKPARGYPAAAVRAALR